MNRDDEERDPLLCNHSHVYENENENDTSSTNRQNTLEQNNTSNSQETLPITSSFPFHFTAGRLFMSQNLPLIDTQVNIGTTPTPTTEDITNTREILTSSSRFRQILPFVILLVLKIFMDHILDLVIISFAIYCLSRMQSLLEEQVALKSRCNIRVLSIAIAIGFFTLAQITGEMYALTKENIWYRLALLDMEQSTPIVTNSQLVHPTPTDSFTPSTPSPSTQPLHNHSNRNPTSFISSLVLVTVLDISLMVTTTILKAIACILIQSSHRLKLSILNNNCRDINHSLSIGTDIENHSNSVNRNIVSSESNSMSGLFLDLVRRRSSDSHSNTHNNTHSNSNTNSVHPSPSHSISIPMNLSSSIAPRAGSATSSDSLDQHQESLRYLFLIRLITVIDGVGLVYRSVVPAPIWLAYYYSGIGGKFFSPAYFIFKVFQISNRIRDTLDVIKIFFQGSLEYGHYSTEQEMSNSSTCECPICFDPITSQLNPITLDCHHMFCEVCILEWLAKEKTCPVCRKDVTCQTPAIQDIRSLASQSIPIVV